MTSGFLSSFGINPSQIVVSPPKLHSYSQLWLWLRSFKFISDIDECAQDPHSCNKDNATCSNTEGSFKYSCKPGFIGDGHSCRGKIPYNEYCNLGSVGSILALLEAPRESPDILFVPSLLFPRNSILESSET